MQKNTDTDKQTKSSWWSITAYGDDKDRLVRCMEGQEVMPNFIKRVYGGLEKCPTTGKEHFQGALNTSHTRFSQIKTWLSSTHIEVRKGTKKQLVAYVMKEETAVGLKSVKSNGRYLSMEEALFLMSDYVVYKYGDNYIECVGMQIGNMGLSVNDDNGFDHISSKVMESEGFHLVSLYSQPQMQRAWKKYHLTFIRESMKKFVEQAGL